MSRTSTFFGICIVLLAVLFSSPPTTETDFRKFLTKQIKKDDDFFESTLKSPLRALRSKLLPVQFHSFGCSSFLFVSMRLYLFS